MKPHLFISTITIIAIVIQLASCKKKPTQVPNTSSDTSGVITTIAGNGTGGYSGDGAAASAAEIWLPCSIAIDNSGNIYIVDHYNVCIRKINTSGIISTIAGNGIAGYSGDGGFATAAELFAPIGVAVDDMGNVYISDGVSDVIRKVNSLGVITTFAGNNIGGYSGDGGPATAAELMEPSGIAVDNSGNLYIADYDNQRIRKVNTSGIITTIAGNGLQGYAGNGGPATSGQLYKPVAVAVDNSNNIYIVDYGNNRICKVNSSGIISTLVGHTLVSGQPTPGYSGDGGPATAAELFDPEGVTLDNSGNVYIADFGNNRIRKVDVSGMISTIAGNGTKGYSGDGGSATSGELYYPFATAIDNSGNIYISDQGNNRIRKISK